MSSYITKVRVFENYKDIDDFAASDDGNKLQDALLNAGVEIISVKWKEFNNGILVQLRFPTIEEFSNFKKYCNDINYAIGKGFGQSGYDLSITQNGSWYS